ncbi:MAG: acyl-CoA dehydrogenase family protein [Myxococcota bacterium]|nr:acyl-CoA dehydrogenase family protein [Myxococcota bacterium]
MDFQLTEQQQMIQEMARDIARRELEPIAAELDETGRFPVESFRKLADVGLLGMNVPEHLGGTRAGTVALSVALTEVAACCASTAVGMSVTNMVGETISRFGSEDLQQRTVPRLTSGDAVCGAFCLSEPGSGSDAASLRATARREGDVYILNGTKMWITSGAYSGVLIVMARTAGPEAGNKGISAFIVEPGFEGFSTGKSENKTGLRGSNTVPVLLENCVVPAANLLGSEGMGFRIAMTALDGGRVTIGAMANGISRAAIDASIAYGKERKQFGKPIAQFQAIGHKLADMQTRLDLSQLLVRRAAWLKEEAGDSGRRSTRQAAMAKLYATESCKYITEEAVQIHGGYGYTREYPVERYMRDSRVTTIFEGTTEIQKMVIAREVLAQIAG